MVTMANKLGGKDLMLAVEQLDYNKLLDFAMKNKSKKHGFSFKAMMEDLSVEEVELMWERLCKVMEEWVDALVQPENKSINRPRKELIRFLNAIIDLGLAFFEINIQATCTGLLSIIVNLNGKMLLLPSTLETLKNKISLLCEKMFLQKNLYQDNVCCNTLLYLLKRSLHPNSLKREVKRLYALRFLINQVLRLETVESMKVMELLKECASNPKFVNTPEGQKIVRIVLTDKVYFIREIHEAIKNHLSTSTTVQAISYGKIYCAAWIYALKHHMRDVKEELELTCIQGFILLAVEKRISKLVENSRKILSQFHSQKKEPDVAKMLYSLYQPILWRYIKSEDGVVRANAAQLFLDVFPLEDPDENIAMADQELNDQMLVIKDLLTDEFQQVRIKAVNGLCVAIMTNWELFPKDMLKTYFHILIDDCGLDSSSHELRCTVVRGLKCILENPLSYPLMGKVLPKCNYMFHDIHESVRLAFVQLLIRVNKIKSIKYYNIVPVEELLERLANDKPLVKSLVCLLKNSYFRNGEGPESWLPRCMDMVKRNAQACNSFFHYIPSYIGLENTVQFIRSTVEALHIYVLSKVSSKKKCVLSTRASSSSRGKVDPEEALGLHDPYMVSGLINGISIMWTVSRPLMEKEENKHLLKMVVSKLTKCLGNLSLYYKDTVAWDAVYFLASQMPSSSIPSLASLCFLRLKSLPEDCDEEEYVTLVECLCSQEGPSFLQLLNEWMEIGISAHLHLTPKTKKRKSRRDEYYCDDTPKPSLALRMLSRALEMRSSQKALLLTCPDKLKETLRLVDPLQKRIEVSVGKKIKDKDFLRSFHLMLFKISGLLQSEDQFDSVKYMENLMEWYQEKLLQPQLPTTINSSWRGTDEHQLPSSDFRELSLGMFEDLCVIMGDMTMLRLINIKQLKHLKFALSLLPLGGAILLPVCKFLCRHINVGIGLLLLNETNVLTIVPDCFSMIIHQINNQGFYDTIPLTDVKEIHMVLSECLSLMHSVNGEMDELLSCITLCILKGILSHMESTGTFQELQKDCNFEKISISPPTSTLLGVVFAKPQIAVFFLKQLQNHLSKPEMNIQTWVSFFAIVKSIWECRKSKIVERELLVLLEKMDGFVIPHPLQMVDINIPQEVKDKDIAKSFEEHCMFEYKKLKDVMAPKATE